MLMIFGLYKTCSLDKVRECYSDIKLWLSNNFLQLNESKTEVLIEGSPMSHTFVGQQGSLTKTKTIQTKL